MTKIYEGLGLKCMYPENWNLIEDSEDGLAVSFTLESPSSAFMTVSEYPRAVSTDSAIEQSIDTMRQEYEGIEEEDYEPNFLFRGEPLDDVLALDLRFYYLDLLVISRLVAFSIGKRTYLIQIQAEDRDFENLEQVFRAMTVSMIASLESSTDEDLNDDDLPSGEAN